MVLLDLKCLHQFSKKKILRNRQNIENLDKIEKPKVGKYRESSRRSNRGPGKDAT